MKKKANKLSVIHITLDDWEGVYLDGVLHDEGHKLGEGESDYYWLRLAEEKGFNSSGISRVCATEELNELINDTGSLPIFFSEIGHLVAKY